MRTLRILATIAIIGVAWDRIVEPLLLEECERALSKKSLDVELTTGETDSNAR